MPQGWELCSPRPGWAPSVRPLAVLEAALSPRGPLRHLGKLGCVRSDPYEPTSTGIGVGRGGAATQNAAHLDLP